MAKLLYMGRNSFRIIGARGTVVYVDPYAGDDYDIPALLLIPCVIVDFLCIHPFSDGNGRVSRLLTLYQVQDLNL